MKNVTLTLDDATYGLVEQKAIALNASVDEVIAEFVRQWSAEGSTEQVRRRMSDLFAQPDWRFAVGTADDREQRNARS